MCSEADGAHHSPLTEPRAGRWCSNLRQVLLDIHRCGQTNCTFDQQEVHSKLGSVCTDLKNLFLVPKVGT